MADILKISDATALAMHSMLYLTLHPGRTSATTEIAEAFQASRHHLAKVHQRLIKAGLMFSTRGPAGGVNLAKEPGSVTLLDIYEIMEGSMTCHSCLFGKEQCPQHACAFSSLLPGLAQQIRTYFEQTTLAKLAEESNWSVKTK